MLWMALETHGLCSKSNLSFCFRTRSKSCRSPLFWLGGVELHSTYSTRTSSCFLHSISLESLEGHEKHIETSWTNGPMDQSLQISSVAKYRAIRASSKRRFSAARRSNSWHGGRHCTNVPSVTGNDSVLFLLLSAFDLRRCVARTRHHGIMATRRQREGQAILYKVYKCKQGERKSCNMSI